MRIAFHGGTLRGFGSGLVGRSVLEHMARARPEYAFLAWVPESWRRDHGVTQASSPPNVELRFTEPGLLHKMTLENRTIRRALKSWEADVLFSAGDTSLIGCPIPHLLLIHQANLAYGAPERGFEPTTTERLRWAAMTRYLKLGLPSVDQITVQTRDMADRISQRHGFDRRRITVVPSAVQGVPGPVRVPESPPQRPYIVYVASAARHKNFELLPPMMQALRPTHPELQCRLTLESDELPWLHEAIVSRGLRDQFVFEGTLSHDRVLSLMSGATAMVMPSWLESFGLPYYEAMMLGVPVVAADRGFAREACGEAGLYADPNNPEDFAAAVGELVRDPSARESRAQAVLERFQETAQTWTQVAERYLELLARLHVR